jgi:hypothetical protein
VELADLADEDRDVILEAVPLPLRLLMIAFHKNHISPFSSKSTVLETLRQQLGSVSVAGSAMTTIPLSFNSKTAVLSVPDLVSGVIDDPTYVKVSKLAGSLKQAPFAISVRVLDLSGHFLRDIDMQHVESALDDVKNCSIILLRNNQFYGREQPFKAQVDDPLRRMLTRAQVRFVDICVNGLATLDRKDLFSDHSLAELSKLIFIPAGWSTEGSWTYLVQANTSGPAAAVATVKAAHAQYYKEILPYFEQSPSWVSRE